MSAGIGLGLDFGSIGIAQAQAQATPRIISESSLHDVTGTGTPSIHPAYIAPIPTRSHRGPRSMGINKKFVSAPSSTLPTTIYDRTPLNPLSLSNPLNSPQLPTHISPAEHLKRSFASRNFGISGANSSPLVDHSSPMIVSPGIAASVGVGDASSSPTLGAGASPTMAATLSPIISSSPVPTPDHNPGPGHEAMVATSIALSVMLGLLVLGMAGWTAYRRRQKARMTKEQEEAEDEEFDATHQAHETFNASNVVEKGLKPKPRTRTSSFISSIVLHPSMVTYQPPSSTTTNANTNTGRRVSFIDSEHPPTIALTLTHEPDMDMYDEIPSTSRRYSIAPPRIMTATLVGDAHADENDSDAEGEEEEEEMDVTDARSFGSARYSSGVGIAPSLEPILEESSLKSYSSEGDLSVIPSRDQQTNDGSERRASIASTSSSSSSSSNASAYTTASARSSISSLSALSIISSAFPQTPRDLSISPPCHTHTHTQGYQYPVPTSPNSNILDSPTPRARARARSQTVVSVKHVDMLRTAVGRTMSLQPTKEVINALKRMTHHADNDDEEDEDEARLAFEEIQLAALVVAKLEAEQLQQQQQQLEADVLVQEGDAMHEEEDEEGNRNDGQVQVTRSKSFPAELLSRRRSQHSNSSPPLQGSNANPARRSEVISGGYLKRALRTFKNENENENDTVPLPLPLSSSIPIPMKSPKEKDKEKDDDSLSMVRLAERQVELEMFLHTLHRPNEQLSESQSPNQSVLDVEHPQLHLHGDSEQESDRGYNDDVEEAGQAFDEYYLDFESHSHSHSHFERPDGDGDGDENDSEESGYQIHEEEDEDFPYDIHEEFGYPYGDDFPLNIPVNHLPHIRITSH